MRRNKIHKNKIIVTLIITTILMAAITVISAFFLANTAMLSLVRDCKEFDTGMEKLAVMTAADIEQKREILYFYEQFIQNTPNSANLDILNSFKKLKSEDFLGLAFLRCDGSVISEDTQYFSPTEVRKVMRAMIGKKKGDPGDVYMGCGQKDVSYYAIPATLGAERGILAGVVRANTDDGILTEEMKADGNRLYVLDGENRVLFYNGTGDREFDYRELSDEDFFDGSGNLFRQMMNIFKDLESDDNNPIVHVRQAEENGSTLMLSNLVNADIFFRNSTYLWFEKTVEAENIRGIKVVACKQAAISGETLGMIVGGGILVAFVIIVSFVMMIILVVSQGMSNKKLGKLAYIDDVTGYHNWTRFELEVQKLFRRRKRDTRYMLVSLDIRKFRVISDMDGEMKGDVLLREVAEGIQKQLDNTERFARFSIDDFGVLLHFCKEEDAVRRVELLDKALKEQTDFPHVAYSYGIYPIQDYAMSLRKMYNYAGIARENAKTGSGSSIGIFTDSMREALIQEKDLESHMERGLANREFQVYLQPKYSPDGRRVGGAEALVRWISPEMGFISPGAFISLFEKNGFIIKLDDYMLRGVCALQRKWMDAGNPLITISVNLSRVHLQEEDVVDKISSIIDEYGIPHSCIEMELTESAFFDDKEVLLQTVAGLKAAGLCTSMDDFGSGYSSLNSLKDLPLDVVKLDGEFFRQTGNADRSTTVIKDTVHLAKHLNMRIVAEGIETAEQVQFLKEIGCDLIQGFYFARPMPSEDFERLMGYDGAAREEKECH